MKNFKILILFIVTLFVNHKTIASTDPNQIVHNTEIFNRSSQIIYADIFVYLGQKQSTTCQKERILFSGMHVQVWPSKTHSGRSIVIHKYLFNSSDIINENSCVIEEIIVANTNKKKTVEYKIYQQGEDILGKPRKAEIDINE